MAEKPASPQLRTTTESSSAVLSTVTQEMSRRSKLSRQDTRLSVKSLIESIENATKQAKAGKLMLCSLFMLVKIKIYVLSNKYN